MDYILKVTDNGIFIPKDIPNGGYKLVPIRQGSILTDELSSRFWVAKPDGTKDSIIMRIQNALVRANIKYLEDLEGCSDKSLSKKRNLGVGSLAVLIIICEKVGIVIEYDEEKYKEIIDKYKGRVFEIK